ncbi:MAG: nitroreductase family protein [Oscillospiraceae bacterium]|nr:nitroreductase family protein [Oscillospiraceae bacterium]
MGLTDVILKRRSIRKYAEDEIPEQTLEKILQAGLLAPTSRNLKPCEFYLVRDRETLKRLSRAKSGGAGMIADCAAAVAVFGDAEKADTWVEDCSIAMSFMMLAAEEQGVGNCWVQIHFRKDADGNDAEANVREILSVPDRYRIAGILALGVPAERPEPHTTDDADWDKVHKV